MTERAGEQDPLATAQTDDPAAPTPGRRSSDLQRAALGGLVWQAVAYLSGRLLVLASTVVLARVLVPSEFGMVSAALVVINLLEGLADVGVSQALIYFPVTARRNDAAVVCSLLSGLALALLVVLLAPWLADLLSSPGSEPLLRLLALSLVLTAVGLVPDMLMRRELQFRRRVRVQLAQGAVNGLVTIVLALSGAGAVSLALGYLAGQLAYCAVAWQRVIYRPSASTWRPALADVRSLLGYGLPVAASGVVTTLAINVDYVIVSSVLGVETLAVYLLAFRLPEMAIISVFRIVSGVSFPVYRRASEDRARLRRGYLRLLRLQAAYGLIVGLVLAAVAPVLVDVLFGPRWAEAVGPLRALAVYAALRSLGLGVVDLLKATGRPRATMVLACVRLLVLVPVLLIAVQDGVDAVAWAQVAVALVLAIGMQLLAARVVGAGVLDLMAACAPAVAAGGVAFAVATVTVEGLHSPGWARLAGATVGGTAAALLVLLAVSAGAREDVRSLLRRAA